MRQVDTVTECLQQAGEAVDKLSGLLASASKEQLECNDSCIDVQSAIVGLAGGMATQAELTKGFSAEATGILHKVQDRASGL